MPSGTAGLGELRYASDLVALIREHSGRHFRLEVACYPEYHPQAKSPRDDLLAFKRKIEAGADGGLTQYFYNTDAYFRFVDAARAAGIEAPIVPGIMPIGNFSQLVRFSDACGAEIPRWLRLKMESFGDDLESIREYGLEVVSGMCQKLLEGGAPGLHFYTMNRADLTGEIWKRLRLS
jgi:methylenetetrahydrofolate reductase (NADPH)